MFMSLVKEALEDLIDIAQMCEFETTFDDVVSWDHFTNEQNHLEQDPTDVAEFQGWLNSLKPPRKHYVACEMSMLTEGLLQEIDRIYVEELRASSADIYTIEQVRSDAWDRYRNRVCDAMRSAWKAIPRDQTGRGLVATHGVVRARWLLTPWAKDACIFPLMTQSVIEDLHKELQLVPNALQEVSTCSPLSSGKHDESVCDWTGSSCQTRIRTQPCQYAADMTSLSSCGQARHVSRVSGLSPANTRLT